MNDKTSLADIFGDVIFAYTRAQALADGVLVDVSAAAREVDLRWPVAMTRAAWEDCVAWSEDDSRRQVHQDEVGRLWDVLWMAFCAIRNAPSGDRQLVYALYRVPLDGTSINAMLTQLKVVAGPGDDGEPVITLMLPGED